MSSADKYKRIAKIYIGNSRDINLRRKTNASRRRVQSAKKSRKTMKLNDDAFFAPPIDNLYSKLNELIARVEDINNKFTNYATKQDVVQTEQNIDARIRSLTSQYTLLTGLITALSNKIAKLNKSSLHAKTRE